jgi:hypothetical protein
MDEGRKGVLGIIAGIPVARHLKATENLFDSRRRPAHRGEGRGSGATREKDHWENWRRIRNIKHIEQKTASQAAQLDAVSCRLVG